MGPEYYFEYLFAPQSHDLIFSYTNAREEGEKYEWRYYYDEKEESHKQEDYYSIDNRSGGGGCIPRYGCDCQPLCR